MLRFALFASFFCHAAMALADSPGLHGASLCLPKERIVFSCHIKKKIVSVCSGAASDGRPEYMQYRFGRPGAVELVLPKERSNSLGAFRGGRLQPNREAVGYLRIRNGPFAYVTYQGASSYGDLPGGLIVEKDGAVVSDRRCDEKTGGGTSLLAYDFWQSAGIERDEKGVDVPEWP
jgi:hypothetical protein